MTCDWALLVLQKRESARDLRLGLAGFAEARESARERVSEEGKAERVSFLGTILRNEVCAQSMLLNLL